MPVSVWKHVSVKKEEERVRIPDEGTEGSGAVREGFEAGNLGVRERVMAWTPWKVPARMSISLEERWWRGEVEGEVWDCVVDGVAVVEAGGPFCAGMKLRW